MPVPDVAQIYLGQLLGGRFEIDKYHAHGSFCLVFEGTDRESGKPVAIKILNPGAADSDVLEFGNEASLLQLLHRATHVVTLVHAGTDTVLVMPVGRGVAVPLSVRYLVLELADASLDELLVRRDQLSFAGKLGLFRDVAHGVHQMHLAGVVHRDIKAENGLLFTQPNRTVVKLADLGRSKRLSEPPRFLAEDYISGRGDVRFAPPEVLWGHVGWDEASLRRADLYLVGSVLYELVVGQSITTMALGAGTALQIARWAHATSTTERKAEYEDKLKEIAARYDFAFALFANEVPPIVRGKVVDHQLLTYGAPELVRQLCNPDPALREDHERGRIAEQGLGWVLRKIDIFDKRLDYAEREAARLATKKLRRSR